MTIAKGLGVAINASSASKIKAIGGRNIKIGRKWITFDIDRKKLFGGKIIAADSQTTADYAMLVKRLRIK